MKQLKPIIEMPEYIKRLEKAVEKVIFDAVFKDVLSVVRKYKLKNFENSSSALRGALLAGKVQFSNGKFTGKFSSSISKELKTMGAKRIKSGWSINEAKLPFAIQSAVAVATQHFKNMHQDILDVLAPEKVVLTIEQSDFTAEYAQNLRGLESQFKQSVKAVGVTPDLTFDSMLAISENYSNNMKLYIQKWSDDNVLKLRELVYDNSMNGFRAEKLAKIIERNFSVSKKKAKFLARQETALMMSTFQENRFKDAGVTKYRWSTSKDSRVRDLHEDLDGKIFTWNEAVIDEHGNRGNPGEAFGCRCIAIPII